MQHARKRPVLHKLSWLNKYACVQNTELNYAFVYSLNNACKDRCIAVCIKSAFFHILMQRAYLYSYLLQMPQSVHMCNLQRRYTSGIMCCSPSLLTFAFFAMGRLHKRPSSMLLKVIPIAGSLLPTASKKLAQVLQDWPQHRTSAFKLQPIDTLTAGLNPQHSPEGVPRCCYAGPELTWHSPYCTGSSPHIPCM